MGAGRGRSAHDRIPSRRLGEETLANARGWGAGSEPQRSRLPRAVASHGHPGVCSAQSSTACILSA
eukprot:6714249-Pyramimonas_sp.AAC.1